MNKTLIPRFICRWFCFLVILPVLIFLSAFFLACLIYRKWINPHIVWAETPTNPQLTAALPEDWLTNELDFEKFKKNMVNEKKKVHLIVVGSHGNPPVAEHNLDVGYYKVLKESWSNPAAKVVYDDEVCPVSSVEKLAFKNLADGQKWRGFTMRYEKMMEFISDLDNAADNDIVIWVDAFDVFIVEDAEIIVEKFLKFNKPIVWSDDINYMAPLMFGRCPVVSGYGHMGGYPNRVSEDIIGKHVLNVGTYIGYAKYIKALQLLLHKGGFPNQTDEVSLDEHNFPAFAAFAKDFFSNDDQVLMNQTCKMPGLFRGFYQKFVAVDRDQELFWLPEALLSRTGFRYFGFPLEQEKPNTTAAIATTASEGNDENNMSKSKNLNTYKFKTIDGRDLEIERKVRIRGTDIQPSIVHVAGRVDAKEVVNDWLGYKTKVQEFSDTGNLWQAFWIFFTLFFK